MNAISWKSTPTGETGTCKGLEVKMREQVFSGSLPYDVPYTKYIVSIKRDGDELWADLGDVFPTLEDAREAADTWILENYKDGDTVASKPPTCPACGKEMEVVLSRKDGTQLFGCGLDNMEHVIYGTSATIAEIRQEARIAELEAKVSELTTMNNMSDLVLKDLDDLRDKIKLSSEQDAVYPGNFGTIKLLDEMFADREALERFKDLSAKRVLSLYFTDALVTIHDVKSNRRYASKSISEVVDAAEKGA